MLSAFQSSSFAGKFAPTKFTSDKLQKEKNESLLLNNNKNLLFDTSSTDKYDKDNFFKSSQNLLFPSIKSPNTNKKINSQTNKFESFNLSNNTQNIKVLSLPGPARLKLDQYTNGFLKREISTNDDENEQISENFTPTNHTQYLSSITFDRGLSQHASWLSALLLLDLPIDDFHLGLTFKRPLLPPYMSFMCYENIHSIINTTAIVRKINHLMVFVKSIIPKGNDLMLLIVDPTGHMPACCHRSVLDEPNFYPSSGTTIILRNITCYRFDISNPYLIITPSNIVRWIPIKPLEAVLKENIETAYKNWNSRINLLMNNESSYMRHSDKQTLSSDDEGLNNGLYEVEDNEKKKNLNIIKGMNDRSNYDINYSSGSKGVHTAANFSVLSPIKKGIINNREISSSPILSNNFAVESVDSFSILKSIDSPFDTSRNYSFNSSNIDISQNSVQSTQIKFKDKSPIKLIKNSENYDFDEFQNGNLTIVASDEFKTNLSIKSTITENQNSISTNLSPDNLGLQEQSKSIEKGKLDFCETDFNMCYSNDFNVQNHKISKITNKESTNNYELDNIPKKYQKTKDYQVTINNNANKSSDMYKSTMLVTNDYQFNNFYNIENKLEINNDANILKNAISHENLSNYEIKNQLRKSNSDSYNEKNDFTLDNQNNDNKQSSLLDLNEHIDPTKLSSELSKEQINKSLDALLQIMDSEFF